MGWIHVLFGVMSVCQALAIPRAVSEPRVDNAPRFLSPLPGLLGAGGRLIYKLKPIGITMRDLSIGRAGALPNARFKLVNSLLQPKPSVTTFRAGFSKIKEADAVKIKKADDSAVALAVRTLIPFSQLEYPISLTQEKGLNAPDGVSGVVLQVPGDDFVPNQHEIDTFTPHTASFDSDISGVPIVAFTKIMPEDNVLFVRGTMDPGELGDGLRGSRWSAMMNANTREMLAAFIAKADDKNGAYSEHDYRVLTAVFYEWNKFKYLTFYKVCSEVKGALGFAAAQDRGEEDRAGNQLTFGTSPGEPGRRDLIGGHNQFLILNDPTDEQGKDVYNQFKLVGKFDVEKVQGLLGDGKSLKEGLAKILDSWKKPEEIACKRSR